MPERVAARLPGRDDIVLGVIRSPGVVTTDRDHVGVVRRVVELRRAETGVARRDDHHDAVMPRDLGRVRQWIELVVLRAVGPEGQVEDPDVQPVAVAVLDDPIDRGDDLRHVGRAVARRHLDRDDASAGSGTHEVVIGFLVLLAWRDGSIASRDQTRHVGAVAIGVDVGQIRSLRVERQVGSVDHLQVDARHGGDARVDQRDVDTFPRPTPLPHLAELRVLRHLPPGTGMLVRIDAVDVAEQPNRGIRRDGGDHRRSTQTDELARRNLRGEPVDDRDATTHLAAGIEDEAFGDVDGSFVSSNDDRDQLVRGCRRRGGREDEGGEQERHRHRTHESTPSSDGARGAEPSPCSPSWAFAAHPLHVPVAPVRRTSSWGTWCRSCIRRIVVCDAGRPATNGDPLRGPGGRLWT